MSFYDLDFYASSSFQPFSAGGDRASLFNDFDEAGFARFVLLNGTDVETAVGSDLNFYTVRVLRVLFSLENMISMERKRFSGHPFMRTRPHDPHRSRFATEGEGAHRRPKHDEPAH